MTTAIDRRPEKEREREGEWEVEMVGDREVDQRTLVQLTIADYDK